MVENLSKKESEKTVFEWPPLESDPEIFTNYLRKLGLKENYYFSELWGLDDETLKLVEGTPHALIVNYERSSVKKTYDDKDRLDHSKVPFYMYQQGKLDNACGIIAALHAVGNNKVAITPNSILDNFFNETKGKKPDEICKILQDHKEFQEEHKVHASKGQSNLCDKQEDVKNHFVCFAVVDGNLVEFDGNIRNPVVIAKDVKEDNFLLSCSQEIKKRLEEKNITESLSILYLTE